ncbi:MAG: hypothetical protein RBR63_10235, partial [Methanosarcina vacuolata]|nr:hypothetical protein [Methanosarcina vacuolata]
MLSIKKEIAGKKTPERLSKNLLTFKKVFLQRDMPGFPELYSRPSLGLFTLIGSPLPFSKNENPNAAAENRESASTSWEHKSKRYPGYNRSEKTFIAYLTAVFQQYPEAKNEVRAGIYERILIPPINKQTEYLQSVLMHSVLKLNSLRNAETKSSRHTKTHAFDWLTAFSKNIVTVFPFNQHISLTSGSTKTLQLNPQFSPISGSTKTLQLNPQFSPISGSTKTLQLNQRFFHTLDSTKALQLDPQFFHTSGSTKALQLNQQETLKLESEFLIPYSHLRIKTISRALIPVFKSLETLFAGNKLTHINETYSIDSSENSIQKNNYHYLHVLLRKAFKLPEVPISFST